MNEADYREEVRRTALHADGFRRLTLTEPRPRDAVPWRKVTVRPIELRDEPHLQFSWFTETKDLTENHPRVEAGAELQRLLGMPFSRVHLLSTEGDIHVRITRKGRVLVSRGKPSSRARPSLAHDRQKAHMLPDDQPDPLLQAAGLMDDAGRVLPTMRPKFRQVNEFLRVLHQTVADAPWAADGVQMVDCGCGKAYLTFAAFRHLRDVLDAPVSAVGVDSNAEVVGQARALRDQLGWEDLEFRVCPIADYVPDRPPAIVLSLHACDTATDEALALGVHWRARAMLAAPCCQHELHRRLRAPVFRPVLRHGVLRERMADLLTDTFRALALRIVGYRTRVMEFVEPDATAKNLMIRAERGGRPGKPENVAEYRALREFWQVTPAIERMLGQELRQHVGEL